MLYGLETQVGIKIAGRNINNLSYADDTTLMRPLPKATKGEGLGWWSVKEWPRKGHQGHRHGKMAKQLPASAWTLGG